MKVEQPPTTDHGKQLYRYLKELQILPGSFREEVHTLMWPSVYHYVLYNPLQSPRDRTWDKLAKLVSRLSGSEVKGAELKSRCGHPSAETGDSPQFKASHIMSKQVILCSDFDEHLLDFMLGDFVYNTLKFRPGKRADRFLYSRHSRYLLSYTRQAVASEECAFVTFRLVRTIYGGPRQISKRQLSHAPNVQDVPPSWSSTEDRMEHR